MEGIAQIISAANLLANPQELEQYYDDIDDQLMSKLERMAELCPSRLKGYRIISIELANLVAGTKYRGEFEERVQSILAEVTDEKVRTLTNYYRILKLADVRKYLGNFSQCECNRLSGTTNDFVYG